MSQRERFHGLIFPARINIVISEGNYIQRGFAADLSNYLSAQRLVAKLEKYGVLREVTGQARNRIYQADEILRAVLEPIDVLKNRF